MKHFHFQNWRLLHDPAIEVSSAQEMEENVQELIQEAVEAAGVIAELDQDIENELINLANNPQVHLCLSSEKGPNLYLPRPLNMGQTVNSA